MKAGNAKGGFPGKAPPFATKGGQGPGRPAPKAPPSIGGPMPGGMPPGGSSLPPGGFKKGGPVKKMGKSKGK